MSTYVDVEDIARGMGKQPSDLDEGQVNQAISDAETLLYVQLGPLDHYDANILSLVIRLAVTDYLRNPEGTSETSWSVDDAAYTRKYSSSSGGRVNILPEWLDWLRPKTGGSAFTVVPG